MEPTRRDNRGFHNRHSELNTSRPPQQRKRSRSRSPPIPRHKPFRTYDSYTPDRPSDQSRLRDNRVEQSAIGQRAPINAPKGPKLTTNLSELRGQITSRGGEDSLPTPASPPASPRGTAGHRSPISARASDNSSAIRGSTNGAPSLDQGPTRINTQLANAQEASAGPIRSAGPRSASGSRSSTPIINISSRPPFSFTMPAASPSGSVGPSSAQTRLASAPTDRTPEIQSDRLREWVVLSEDKDAHIVATIFAKLQHDHLESKIKSREDDMRRFASLALDAEYAGSETALLQSQQDELSNNKKLMKIYSNKRHELCVKMGALLEGSVAPRPQLDSSSMVSSTSPDILSKVELLETRVRELNQRALSSGSSERPADASLIAIQSSIDALEKSAARTELVETRFAAMEKELAELRVSTAVIPRLTAQVDHLKTVHTRFTEKFAGIESRLDDVSTRLEKLENSDERETNDTLTPALQQKLEEHFVKIADGNNFRKGLADVQQNHRDLKQELTDFKADVDKYSALPDDVRETRTSLTEVQTQSQTNQKQLQRLQTEVQQWKASRTVPLPSPQPTEGGMQVDAPTAATRPVTWGVVQREMRDKPTGDAQNQNVADKLRQLEHCVMGLIQRMDNTSTQPQAKAILALMLEHVPNAPEILQEVRLSRQQRAEVEQRLTAQTHHIGRVDQANKALEARMTVAEKSITDRANASSELEALVKDVKFGLETTQAGLAASDAETAKHQEQLDAIAPKLAACDTWYKRSGGDMQDKLKELNDVLNESNIRKLQQLPDNLSSFLRGLQQQQTQTEKSRSSATPGSPIPAQIVQGNRSAVQANNDIEMTTPRDAAAKDAELKKSKSKARTFSDRESGRASSDDDSDDVQLMQIRTNQQSRTPSQPSSRPSSTIGVRPPAAPGMKKVFFNKRTKKDR